MANDYDTKAKNVMLDALALVAVRIALHTGDPGGADGAANEVTGGSPAYARKLVTWNVASGGSIDDSNVPVFDIPAGTTVTWASFWDLAGTSRYAKKAITSESFTNQGTYTLLDADLDLNDA